MPSWLPSVNYPPPGKGYWSPVTSTINWCEEDYYATPYSAEIVNSITNLWFIYLAFKGITSCVENGHDKVYLYGYFSYLMIGVGSFIFHSTLKYSMQLLDELSMIYTACILFFATFEYGLPPAAKLVLAGLTSTIAIFVTGYYHYLGDPVFHQNTFALLTAVVFFRSFHTMLTSLKSRASSTYDDSLTASERLRRKQRDEVILSTMWKMIPVGLASVASGFLLWNLDNTYCSYLRNWRRQLGLPWGILLEFHGWWHLLTGIAEYFNLVWSTWLRYCLEGRQDEVELVWPSLLTSMPELVKKKRQKQG